MLQAAFSDRWRPLTLGAALLLLAAVMGAWVVVRLTVAHGYWSYLEEPQAHAGDPVVLSIFEVDELQAPDGYIVEKGFQYVPVAGDPTGLQVGQEVSVGGHFRPVDGAVVEEWREIHRLRDAKKALGVLGLLAMLILTPFCFGLRRGGLVCRG